MQPQSYELARMSNVKSSSSRLINSNYVSFSDHANEIPILSSKDCSKLV